MVLYPGSEGHSTLTPPWGQAGTLCLWKTPGVRLTQTPLPPGSDRDLNTLHTGAQASTHRREEMACWGTPSQTPSIRPVPMHTLEAGSEGHVHPTNCRGSEEPPLLHEV